jgi:hypothetical protein
LVALLAEETIPRFRVRLGLDLRERPPVFRPPLLTLLAEQQRAQLTNRLRLGRVALARHKAEVRRVSAPRIHPRRGSEDEEDSCEEVSIKGASEGTPRRQGRLLGGPVDHLA